MTHGVSSPKTLFSHNFLVGEIEGRWVLRPCKHRQGRNLWMVRSRHELFETVSRNPVLQENGWYVSKFIDKTNEYRVFVFKGKAFAVAEKIPEDRDLIAWNFCEGADYGNVRWGNWNLPCVNESIKACEALGLDFGAVDVILSPEGDPYVLEVNTAPAMPNLEDGTPSYRQKLLAKVIAYHYHGGECEDNGHEGWRKYIHPAIWPRTSSDT